MDFRSSRRFGDSDSPDVGSFTCNDLLLSHRLKWARAVLQANEIRPSLPRTEDEIRRDQLLAMRDSLEDWRQRNSRPLPYPPRSKPRRKDSHAATLAALEGRLHGVSVLSLAMHLVLNIVYNVALHLTPNVVGPNAALNLDHSLSPVPWPYTVNLRFRPMKSRP
ncbi:hypothetical protein PG999_013417 [Apiospora kogelbergensis]|uniref:Uncharacterized protein n=1 Tax=Apiospora kogelbergensis TaxID=1337665 RepID=A0AAW0QFC8_9PEZI